MQTQTATEAESVRIIFELFGKLDPTKPFKLIPLGTWFRGRRKLDITRARLEEVVKNFKGGLPPQKVLINLDHAENGGKVGNVKDLAYMEDGPKGPGLYVTEIELTDKGNAALDEDGYDGVSAEIVWTLNEGAMFQDPKTGDSVDNVLVGMALTPQPFFGHDEVGLFANENPQIEVFAKEPYDYNYLSAGFYGGAKSFNEYDEWQEAQQETQRLKSTDWIFRDLLDNIWYDETFDASEKAQLMMQLIGEFQARVQAGGEELMSQANILERVLTMVGLGPTREQPETNSIPDDGKPEAQPEEKPESQEELEMGKNKEKEEELQTETQPEAEIEKLQQDAAAEKLRADTAEAEIDKMRAGERSERLKVEAGAFKALPMPVDEYVEHFTIIEEKLPEDQVKWLRGQLEAYDKAMVAGGLLKEIGSDLETDQTDADRLESLVQAEIKESFAGDRSKYGEAMKTVSAAHPELAKALVAAG
ncbi:hypothetical protein LCGC14_1516860 [marine sediment metagenome]|uniref:Uncharacterized protein n=1 Tax=marine sediment metagenome TaxID=412755 RepID=A0A0F9J007_9ZZZZ